MSQIGLIACCNGSGLIGYNGAIPWHHTEDLRFFKKTTKNSIVVMGRKTWESLPTFVYDGGDDPRKLPGRIKHVLSRSKHEDTDDTKWFSNLIDAVSIESDKVIWIIGGEEIYKEALSLRLPDVIELSILDNIWIPPVAHNRREVAEKSRYMPVIPYFYRVESEILNNKDDSLWHRRYVRRSMKGINL